MRCDECDTEDCSVSYNGEYDGDLCTMCLRDFWDFIDSIKKDQLLKNRPPLPSN